MTIQRADILYPVNTTTVDTGVGIDIRLLDSAEAAADDVTQTATFTHTNDNVERTFDPATGGVTNTNNAATTLFTMGYALRLAEDMTPTDDTNCDAGLLAGTIAMSMRMNATQAGGTYASGTLAPTFKASLWRYNIAANTGTLIASGSTTGTTWNVAGVGGDLGTAKTATFNIVIAAPVAFAAGEVPLVQYGFNTGTVPNPTLGTATFTMTLTVDVSTTNIDFEAGQGIRQVCALSSSNVGVGTVSRVLAGALSRSATGKGLVFDPETPLISDTFTGTAGTDLVSHTPDVGGAWYESYTPGQFVLTNANRLRNNISFASVDQSAQVLPLDVDIRFDIVTGAAAIGGTEIFWALSRASNSEYTHYACGAVYLSGIFYITLYRYNNNVQTLLAGVALNSGWPASTTYSVLWTSRGAVHKVYVNNVSKISVTDASPILAIGQTGFRAAVAATDTNGIWLDNFNVRPPPVKAVVAAKTFSLIGKGEVAYSRLTVASRSFDLIGKGEITRVLDVGITRDNVGTGEVSYTKEVVAAKSFDLVGKGEVSRTLAVDLSRNVDGNGEITEAHSVQAFRTFDLVGVGTITGTITIPIDEVPEGGGGVTINPVFTVFE